MKKVLYLTHIDWNWIKQRPQFIAERLSKICDLTCITPHWYNRKKLQVRKDKMDSRIKFIEFYGIPRAKKIVSIRKINNNIRGILTKYVAYKKNIDIIYVCHPELYSKWMENYKGLIIYDCMDDHCALVKEKSVKKMIEEKEKKLVSRADILLASSLNLKNNLIQKYKCESEKVFVVRNGFDGKILENLPQKAKSKVFKIGYIGTVSSWFNFEILEESLKCFDDVEYHIIGPVQNEAKKIDNKKIIFEGVVEHHLLAKKINDYDALIMPFVVNDIVESVDPVKLYEYINFSKPIISVYYKEVERFKNFVWFYSNSNELNEIIRKIKLGEKKYTNDMRVKFLESSNWEERVNQIATILEKHDK